MRIVDVLKIDLILPDVGTSGRDEVLRLLGERLCTAHPAIDRGGFVDALHVRERQMTTALGDGIAIPHARLAGLEQPVAVFARSRSGIAWDAVDGRPTHLVFALAAPLEAPGASLKVLSTISRVLAQPRCRTRLLEATDEAALLAVLDDEDARSRRVAHAA